MSAPLTPGEMAYEAYLAVVLPSDWRVALAPWADLPALYQEAWEAAAQAVLTQAGLLILDLDPEETRDA